MSSSDPSKSPSPPTVFLSYASEDRPAAEALRDALPAYGVEVWYDEAELSGGEAWDQKIRRLIRECDFFMAVISAQTQARHEGYFRREWRLATERSLDMSDDRLFLLPVVIDGTPQAGARVPEKFLAVQWTQVPGGKPNKALEALCRRLLMGDVGPTVQAAPAQAAAGGACLRPAAQGVQLPPMPQKQPGQEKRYARELMAWSVQAGWAWYRGLTRGWQVAIAAILLVVVFGPPLSTHDDDDDDEDAPHRQAHSSAEHSRSAAASQSASAEIERQVRGLLQHVASAVGISGKVPLLAIPFTAAADDADARKLAEGDFAALYGRLALSHHGHARVLEKPPPQIDDATALKRAREQHAAYVLLGSVAGAGSGAQLTVRLLKTDDVSQTWSHAYPAQDADVAAIASELDAQLPKEEEP